jgi:YtkA-like
MFARLGSSRPRRGLSILLAALALAGCSRKTAAGSPAASDDGSECSGDFDAFEPGMTKQTASGAITVELKDAEPSPPVVRSDNVWWLELTDADGAPLTGAEIVASPYMPKHQHGSAEVVVDEQGEGAYRLSPIELVMPGVWEIPVSLTLPDGTAGEVTFRFCIAER